MCAVSGWGQGELGLNPQCDPASHPDQGEAVGVWLGVWHLWVDGHPQQALRLGCLPPVWASRVHQPRHDLQCAPSAWNKIKRNFNNSCGDTGLGKQWYSTEKKIRGKSTILSRNVSRKVKDHRSVVYTLVKVVQKCSIQRWLYIKSKSVHMSIRNIE